MLNFYPFVYSFTKTNYHLFLIQGVSKESLYFFSLQREHNEPEGSEDMSISSLVVGNSSAMDCSTTVVEDFAIFKFSATEMMHQSFL